MKRIDGKEIASLIRAEVADEVTRLAHLGKEVCLAVIQVGHDPASSVYVRNKKLACKEAGIRSVSYELEEDISQDALLALIQELNADSKINGILVQLPLPEHISENAVICAIDSKKDVDGFHPENVGRLWSGQNGLVSCTPAGVIELLRRSHISMEGADCVIVGRSNIVGKPMAALMIKENATVTVAHSKTENLSQITRRADILIVCAGVPKMIGADMVKEGAVVIDVGIHRPAGEKLCGDVDFDAVAEKCTAITPVPGGVGPMTIAMLLKNCVEAARLQESDR